MCLVPGLGAGAGLIVRRVRVRESCQNTECHLAPWLENQRGLQGGSEDGGSGGAILNSVAFPSGRVSGVSESGPGLVRGSPETRSSPSGRPVCSWATVVRTAATFRMPGTLAEQHGRTSTAARPGATEQTRRACWEQLSG